MISISFLAANRLNRLLDAIVAQDGGARPAEIAAIDPHFAETAMSVQQLAGTPRPDGEFTEELLHEILANRRGKDSGPAPVDPGPLRQLSPSARGAWQRPRSLSAATVSFAATAALVLLTLASAWVMFGSGRARWSIDQMRPALSITSPDTTSSEEIATLVWTSRGDATRPIDNPGHMTVDPAGNLWVVDPGDSEFQIWSPEGELIERWGEAGTELGQFHFEIHGFPSGAVAFDAAGNLYVADAGNRRVQKFSPERTFIRSWGSEGTGDGQFLQPDNLAIDQQGRVYVLDGDRDDIQVFDADGNYLKTIGRYGVGEGQFLFFDNGGLTVDGNGDLWVADISNQRIQKFSPDGTFLTAIGKFGFNAGEFSSPNGIAVDDAGLLFVVDVGQTGTRLQIFSADGVYLGGWSESDGRTADLSTATSLALDGNGNVYVSDYSDDQILKLRILPPFAPAPANDGAMLEWQATGDVDRPLDHPAALAIDPAGRVWVADTFNHGYQIFSTDGRHIENWGAPGSEPGHFNFQPAANMDPLPAGGIAFAPDGSFYVADSGNARVQKFGPDRALLLGWGVKGEGDGQFMFPTGVATDQNGRVYVADALRNDIQVFTADGAFLDVIGGYGVDQGRLYLLSGGYVNADGSGNLWVTDTANHRLQKFSGEGEFLQALGKAGNAQGQFSAPGQVAIDADGRLFVADRTNGRVQIFDREGTFLASIGNEDRIPDFFPAGTALDGAGSLYVSDFFEDRVLKFQLPPSLISERSDP